MVFCTYCHRIKLPWTRRFSYPASRRKNVLFEMVFQQAQTLYIFIPFLVLSIIATVIASQSIISGMFSIVYQGITTRIMPMFKVDYTSSKLRSQIFIGSVNWFLLVSVLCIMVKFKESHRLGAAYSLSVAGPMVITGIIMTWIFYLKDKILKGCRLVSRYMC